MSEDHTEHLHEEIHEHAHGAKEKWIGLAALTAALLAGLAAICGSMAGTHLTESSRAQIAANDDWSYYQAKSIKSSLLATKDELLTALGKERNPKDLQKAAEYDKQMEDLRKQGDEEELISKYHLVVHEKLDEGVTFFHIAIAIVAIAVLTKRKSFYCVSVVFGVIGLVFMILALQITEDAYKNSQRPAPEPPPATHAAA